MSLTVFWRLISWYILNILSKLRGAEKWQTSFAVCMPEFDGALHSVPVSTNEEREDGTHYRMPLADRINMLVKNSLTV